MASDAIDEHRLRRLLEVGRGLVSVHREAILDRLLDAAGCTTSSSYLKQAGTWRGPRCDGGRQLRAGRLDGVAGREDALGRLARVFQRMAREVDAGERALKEQVKQLSIEIDQARASRQFEAITETDYFRELERRVDELRAR